MLSIASYTADSLVENNIFINGNKVMVMRASGGGNVIGYNYFDNGYIGNYLGWMETGLNASHMACPHFELFEGNQAFNIDGDDTWGGAVYNTFFRNHATGKRRSFADLGNRRAIGLMYGHYYYSFVGNVLGTADQNPAPFSGFAYEDFYPWEDDPIGLWRLGYTPENWNAPAERARGRHRPPARELRLRDEHRATGQTGYDTDAAGLALPDGQARRSSATIPGPGWMPPDPPSSTRCPPAPATTAGTPTHHTLTVAKAGTGSGTVTSSPAGINCGATCSASFPAATVVTLTAAPAAGSTFAGWSGACSGTGPARSP